MATIGTDWKKSETDVDDSLLQYRVSGLAHSQVNYPQIRIQKFPMARVVGKAGADRTACIAPLGGRTCHLEVKTWKGKDFHTYDWTTTKSKRRRRAQYEFLMDSIRFGALAFYLVKWRHKEENDWRLHQVEGIEQLVNGLKFYRSQGLIVPTDQGWPDWLTPILLTYSTN